MSDRSLTEEARQVQVLEAIAKQEEALQKILSLLSQKEGNVRAFA